MTTNYTDVAIFCLDGDVNLYAETLRFVSWKLKREKCNIIRFGCVGTLSNCTSFNSKGAGEIASPNRDQICKRCKYAQQQVKAHEIFEVGPDDMLVDDSTTLFLDRLNELLTLKRRVSDDILRLNYGGFPICKIAFFDFSIVNKIGTESVLTDFTIERFIDGVTDLIKLLHAFERFRLAFSVTHIVYVNGNYSQNTLIREFFSRLGVICLSIEPQLTSQNILNHIMFKMNRIELHPESLYPAIVDTNCAVSFTLTDYRNIFRNFGARINGGDFNAYTSLRLEGVSDRESHNLNEFFKCHDRIHSYFLSSEDELTPHSVTHDFNGDKSGHNIGEFTSQFEFTEYLLKEASNFSAIGFVVRIHPRMAINKRNKFESEEHLKYKKFLIKNKLPQNVLVLYGDSKISSYYIINKSDLVIVSWSTIGLEALLLGVPVVSIFPGNLMYPIYSFTHHPRNNEELTQALFTVSTFGRIKDRNLIAWISSAFEGQFFATTALRVKKGHIGRVYSKIYKFLIRWKGGYEILAWMVDGVFLRKVKFNSKRLLVKKELKHSLESDTGNLSTKELIEYRKKYGNILAEYGQQLHDIL